MKLRQGVQKLLEYQIKKNDVYDYWVEIPEIDESLYPIIENYSHPTFSILLCIGKEN